MAFVSSLGNDTRSHLLYSVVTQLNRGSAWEGSTHGWNTKKQGSLGATLEAAYHTHPGTSTTPVFFGRLIFLPILSLWFGRNDPTTARPELQSRADDAGLVSQLVPSLGHHDWVTGWRVAKLIW